MSQAKLQKKLQKIAPEIRNVVDFISLTEFLDSNHISPTSYEYETILDMWLAGGQPYVKHGLKPTPDEELQKGREVYRANFLASKKNDIGADTLNLGSQYPKDYLAEIAHAIQFNAPQSVRDSLSVEASKQRKAYGEHTYGLDLNFPVTSESGESFIHQFIPKGTSDLANPDSVMFDIKDKETTVEHEAHSIIEPLLYDIYLQARKRDELSEDFVRDVEEFMKTKKKDQLKVMPAQ